MTDILETRISNVCMEFIIQRYKEYDAMRSMTNATRKHSLWCTLDCVQRCGDDGPSLDKHFLRLRLNNEIPNMAHLISEKIVSGSVTSIVVVKL